MNAQAQTACPRCNSALAPGAQFCGACGSPLGAAPQPPQQPAYAPPPPMPQMPSMANMARGFSGGGGGNSKQVNLNAAPMDAFNTAMGVIEGMGSEVHYRQPPQGAKYLLTYKSMWSTLGIPIKYDGDMQVAPSGPGQSVVRLSLKVRWGSALPLFLVQAATTFFASMFNLYFAVYFFFILALYLGITAWAVSSSLPEKALKEMGDKMAQGGGFAPAPAQYAPAPQHPPAYGAAPAPQAPPQPAPQPAYAAPPMAPAPTPQGAPGLSGGSDTARIMEQIKQLGALRDAGILSAAEFDAKKAELLARI